MEEDKEKPKKPRRPKGDGGYQKISDDQHKVQISIYDSNGKRHRKSFTASTKKAAIAMLNKFKAEYENGTLVAPQNITIEHYVKRWLASKEFTVKAKSYATYKFACDKHIIPTIGGTKLQKVTTAMLNDYFGGLGRQGIASATMAQHRAILSGVMTLAVSEGIIGKNPVASVTTIPKTRSKQVVLSDEQMTKLLDVARVYKGKYKGKRLQCIYHIILLALATGMRRGELLGLQWNNVGIDSIRIVDNLVEINGEQVLDTPKSENGERSFSVEPEVLKILRDELWTDKEGLVFQANGVFIKFTSLTRDYKNCLELAGIPRTVRLHDLRHTHVTHLLANHYDIAMVSQRIGDDPRTVMGTYAHVMPEKDKEASKFMGSKLLSQVPKKCLSTQNDAELQ